MLLVDARVDRSNIHGLGLFAVTHIPAGTVVWCFTSGFDLDVEPSLVETQPPFLRERLLHYGYIDVRLHRYILCCDDARFINHSDRPNISPEFGRDQYGIDIAVRDIAGGEEITIDYQLIEGTRPE